VRRIRDLRALFAGGGAAAARGMNWFEAGPRAPLQVGQARPVLRLDTEPRRTAPLPMGASRPLVGVHKRHNFARKKRNYTDSSNSEHSDSRTDGHPQGKIFRLPKGSSKEFGVYWKGKKITFGDPSMPNHQNDDERRANFNARHSCSEKKDKTKAGFWACRVWRKGFKTSG
jgi:hypothetical protein